MGPRKTKLKLVRETEAQGRVREIYDDIKRLFAVPYVDLIFQAFAASPKFLDQMWVVLSPALQTSAFFSCSDRLRAEAITIMHNYYSVPDLCARMKELSFSEGAQHELTDVVELFCYNDALLLLFIATASRAMDTPTGTGMAASPADQQRSTATEKPLILEDMQSPPGTLQIFDDIQTTLGFAFVNSDYRAFARWPDFLKQYWAALKPTVRSPIYTKHMVDMRDTALSFAADLPGSYDLTVTRLEESGISGDDAAQMAQIADVFLDNLSGLMLNVAFAKLSLEDGTERGIVQQPEAAADAETEKKIVRQSESTSTAEHVA